MKRDTLVHVAIYASWIGLAIGGYATVQCSLSCVPTTNKRDLAKEVLYSQMSIDQAGEQEDGSFVACDTFSEDKFRELKDDNTLELTLLDQYIDYDNGQSYNTLMTEEIAFPGTKDEGKRVYVCSRFSPVQ